MNRTFRVQTKTGLQYVVIRQDEHDPKYTVGKNIPSYGKVVEVVSTLSEIAARPVPKVVGR